MKLDIRHPVHPDDFMCYNTEETLDRFFIPQVFAPDEALFTYSHFDRIIAGGVMPVKGAVALTGAKELASETFLERREMGAINVGGAGRITVDGVVYEMKPLDGLYIGMGAKEITLESADPADPAKFYINTCPAHHTYPCVKVDATTCAKRPLGDAAACNKRTIYQYIHPAVMKTCQLCMGVTILESGSNWNTMPCHTHERRMEVYFYFKLGADDVVFHLMGEPDETRHIVMRNEQAVISPSWSIHAGVGTRNYAFIWGMCGENQTFDDMDAVKMTDLR